MIGFIIFTYFNYVEIYASTSFKSMVKQFSLNNKLSFINFSIHLILGSSNHK